jgi:transcriptional regulator with XRE-family HTH domain
MFMFNKEMGKKLVLLRKKANLTQAEIAKRMRIKSKSGQSFIAQLENGLIINPGIRTLFNYLSACGASWTEFVREVETSYSKTRSRGIVSQVKLPSDWLLQKKIDRDITLYTNKITGVPKTSVTIDVNLVKEKIKSKVLKLLASHLTAEKLIPTYLDYAWHMFDRELNPNPNPALDNTPWIKSGIKPLLFTEISRIVHKTFWAEKKKLIKRKPLAQDTQDRMAVRFGSYRSQIEPIELAVHRLLCEIVIPEVLFPSYKAYTRECFKAIRKYFSKDPVLLKQKLSNINQEWIANKLNPEVLDKIQNTILAVYQNKL